MSRIDGESFVQKNNIAGIEYKLDIRHSIYSAMIVYFIK